MEFDPRDHDSRERDRETYSHHEEPSHRTRGSGLTHDRKDDLRSPQIRKRDDGNRSRLGRGPGSGNQNDESAGGDQTVDARWIDRDADARVVEPRNVFARDVELPHGRDRQAVFDPRERSYALRGSETRTLTTVGAFRVVSARDLRDHDGRSADPRSGDLRHLREQGLVRTHPVGGHGDHVVVLTDRGRDLLNAHRADRNHSYEQTFYAGLVKPREVEHDAQIYRAYLHEADKLAERGARVERVVLDYELKRDYQRWLHERDANREDADGRPDRVAREIEEWAREHDLPYFDNQVHFPDLRIEYQEVSGRYDHLDVEVLTAHYRGAHAAAAARSGFSSYRGSSLRVGSRNGGSRGGGRLGGLAEELLR